MTRIIYPATDNRLRADITLRAPSAFNARSRAQRGVDVTGLPDTALSR